MGLGRDSLDIVPEVAIILAEACLDRFLSSSLSVDLYLCLEQLRVQQIVKSTPCRACLLPAAQVETFKGCHFPRNLI